MMFKLPLMMPEDLLDPLPMLLNNRFLNRDPKRTVLNVTGLNRPDNLVNRKPG